MLRKTFLTIVDIVQGCHISHPFGVTIKAVCLHHANYTSTNICIIIRNSCGSVSRWLGNGDVVIQRNEVLHMQNTII